MTILYFLSILELLILNRFVEYVQQKYVSSQGRTEAKTVLNYWLIDQVYPRRYILASSIPTILIHFSFMAKMFFGFLKCIYWCLL